MNVLSDGQIVWGLFWYLQQENVLVSAEPAIIYLMLLVVGHISLIYILFFYQYLSFRLTLYEMIHQTPA